MTAAATPLPRYRDVAHEYLAAGWAPLPLPGMKKYPPPAGFTGEEGRWPTDDDIEGWAADSACRNVALRLPDTVVGIDVDDYDDKDGGASLDQLVAVLGALPPTWTSTARPRGRSGIRLYRVPAGVRFKDQPMRGIDIIQHTHRYMVAWPSSHPSGQQYRLLAPDGRQTTTIPTPDELPELPPTWLDHLRRREPAADELAPPTTHTVGTGSRPGDLYNECATPHDVDSLLRVAGCTLVSTGADGSRLYARPGKDPRNGASLQVGGTGYPDTLTTVYTTGWDRLPAGSYTPFRLLAQLQFGGRYDEAARFLAQQGYTSAAPQPADTMPTAPTDFDISEAFTRSVRAELLYARGVGWLAWDGTRFVAVSESVLIVRIGRYVKSLLARIEADRMGSDLAKSYGQYLNVKARQRLLVEARGHLEVNADTLDADRGLLNTPDGIVDLRDGRLTPHDPARRMTRITAARYNPTATSGDWDKALSAVTSDVADYLQVALGATTVGRPIADQVFVALGSGGNGKSTVFGAVAHALGDYATPITSKVLTGDTNENQLLMPLRGARLALAAESGEDHYLNMERLKALSGGDRISDRNLYAKEWAHWDPTHTLWLMTNHRPRVKNNDEGTWRRLRLVPFTSSYVRPEERDTGLRDRLHDDNNAAAVLAWVTIGARRWLTDKRLPESIEVERATETWRDEEDIIAVFLAEAGDIGYVITGERHDTIPANYLYKHDQHGYVTWADSTNRKRMSQPTFKAEMERYARRLADVGRPFPRWERTNTGVVWRGLRLADTADRVGDVATRANLPRETLLSRDSAPPTPPTRTATDALRF